MVTKQTVLLKPISFVDRIHPFFGIAPPNCGNAPLCYNDDNLTDGVDGQFYKEQERTGS